MSEDNLESLRQRLSALTEENQTLRQQLKEDEEIYCDRLVIKAREKLLKWLQTSSIFFGLSTTILTVAFVIWGIKNFHDFERKIQTEIEKIDLTEPVQRSVDKLLGEQIIQYSQETLKNTIESEVKNQVSQELNQTSPKFLVVLGSSQNPADLIKEYSRAEKISGEYFGIAKYEVKICDPKSPNNNYALVLGSELTYTQAEKFVRQAIADNFRATNVYPIPVDSAFFETNQCLEI